MWTASQNIFPASSKGPRVTLIVPSCSITIRGPWGGCSIFSATPLSRVWNSTFVGSVIEPLVCLVRVYELLDPSQHHIWSEIARSVNGQNRLTHDVDGVTHDALQARPVVVQLVH